MRYSDAEVNEPQTDLGSRASLTQLLRSVEGHASASLRRGAIVLVGGVSPQHLVVRSAQSGLRYDRYPSDWSHAAVVLEWPDEASEADILIGHVALEHPEDPLHAVRNGLQVDRLSRYRNARWFPNLAVAWFAHGSQGGERHARVVEAAGDPNRERTRFPFYEWIGPWLAHAHAPHAAPNPLAVGIPHPGAALVEFAFEVAGLHATPGATEPTTCPETLWATIRRWSDRLAPDDVQLRYLALRRDRRDPAPGEDSTVGALVEAARRKRR